MPTSIQTTANLGQKNRREILFCESPWELEIQIVLAICSNRRCRIQLFRADGGILPQYFAGKDAVGEFS